MLFCTKSTHWEEVWIVIHRQEQLGVGVQCVDFKVPALLPEDPGAARSSMLKSLLFVASLHSARYGTEGAGTTRKAFRLAVPLPPNTASSGAFRKLWATFMQYASRKDSVARAGKPIYRQPEALMVAILHRPWEPPRRSDVDIADAERRTR